MKSTVSPQVVHRIERVVLEEQVVAPASVTLSLPVDEFLALYALYYLKGNGNTPMRYQQIEPGLTAAAEDLADASPEAKKFLEAIRNNRGDRAWNDWNATAFERIDSLLREAGLLNGDSR